MNLQDDETMAPPLTWRVWLLVPLVFVSLVGVVVPLNESRAPQQAPKEYEGKPSEPRVPYDDELDKLLSDHPEIEGKAWRTIYGLHQECVRKRNAAGKIKKSLRGRVDRLLEKYR